MTVQTSDGLLQRLTILLDRIPRGRLASRRTVAHELATTEAHIVSLLHSLDPDQRSRHPWHRVVADGGAVGRHVRRDEQIARLRAEGVAVAPAGIVDGFRERRIDRFIADLPLAGPSVAAGSRARGSKGQPQSTIGREPG